MLSLNFKTGLIGLCAAALLSACSQAEAPSAPTPSVQAMAPAVPSAPTKPVKTYAVLEFSKDFAKSVGVTDGMPKAEAEAAIRAHFTDAEGETVTFEPDTLVSGISRVVVTRSGLKDDSVSAEQFIAMFKTAPDGSESVFNHGLRIKCARGSNPDTWQNTLCP